MISQHRFNLVHLMVLVLSASFSAAHAEVHPTTMVGRISNLPAEGGKATALMGHQGCIVIRSAARYQELSKRLTDAGWETPQQDASADKGNLTVMVYKFGDIADRFSCNSFAGTGDNARLEVVMNYTNYLQRDKPEFAFNFIFVTIPAENELDVAVSTAADPAKPDLEWKAHFGPNDGDIVDGLRVELSSPKKPIAPGSDITATVKLNFVDAATVKAGHFAAVRAEAYVWDGKYSNGYRSFGFRVTTPDGKTQFFQPKLITAWDKNAPHPVRVHEKEPYVLPGWSGDTHALKDLGLDTTLPGVYKVTCIYAEQGEKVRLGELGVSLWAGSAASDSIDIEVKP